MTDKTETHLSAEELPRLGELAAKAIAERSQIKFGNEDYNRFRQSVKPEKILALLSERASLVAQVGVLAAACTPTRAYSGDAPDVIERRCKLCNDVAYSREPIAHMPDCPLRDLPAAASALLQEVVELRATAQHNSEGWNTALTIAAKYLERVESAEARVADLERNARTPGTVEVCERWRNGNCCNASNRGTEEFEFCDLETCPLRTSRPAPAATDAKEGGE